MNNSKLLKKIAQLSMGLSLIILPASAVQAQAVVEIAPKPGSGTCIGLNATGAEYEVMTISGNTSNYRWWTDGDIRITGYNGDSSVVTVESYTNRPAPLDEPYGKGRLWLRYRDDSISRVCADPYIYYDINKIIPKQPDVKIIGPTCARAGDTVTFSIDALVSVNLTNEIGLDRYFWDATPGVIDEIIYYSGDSSSITFELGSLTGNDTLYVDIGQCNLNDGFRYKLPIGQSLDSLNFLAGKEPVECLPLNTDTFELAFTPQANVDYEWDIEGSWGFIAPLTGSSVSFLPDNSDATILITAENDCETKVFEYRITRSLSDSNYIVSNTCLPGGIPHQFTINNITGGVTMNWSVSGPGWSIDPGQRTRTDPTIDVGTGTGQVIVSTANCPNKADTLTVFIQPETPGAISGDTCIPQNDLTARVYSISSVANATSYEWFYPNNWTTTGATDQTSITLNPDGSTVGKVGVIAIGCSESDTSFIDIGFSSTIPDSILVSNNCILSGGADTVIFSVQTPISGETYEWDIPSQFGTILNYQSTGDSSEVEVETSGYDSTYVIRVRSKASCGFSDWDSLEVIISGLNVSINYTKDVFPGYSQFAVNPNPTVGATYYEWYKDGVSQIDGASQTVYLVPNSQLPATVCVDVTDSSACITTACISATYPSPPPQNPGPALRKKSSGGINSATNSLQVSPNPTKSQLNLKFGQSGTYDVLLINNNGQVVLQKQVNNVNQHQIDLSSYSNGTYYLAVQSTSGFTATETIINVSSI